MFWNTITLFMNHGIFHGKLTWNFVINSCTRVPCCTRGIAGVKFAKSFAHCFRTINFRVLFSVEFPVCDFTEHCVENNAFSYVLWSLWITVENVFVLLPFTRWRIASHRGWTSENSLVSARLHPRTGTSVQNVSVCWWYARRSVE